jgi:hypothetical protein
MRRPSANKSDEMKSRPAVDQAAVESIARLAVKACNGNADARGSALASTSRVSDWLRRT